MNRFDERIRHKLEDHQVERPSDAWERFANMMPPGKKAHDEDFDAFVQKQLEKHQAHYEHRHWDRLRLSMDLQAHRLHELALAKMFEIVVALLLILPVLSLMTTHDQAPPSDDQPVLELPIASHDPTLPDFPKVEPGLAAGDAALPSPSVNPVWDNASTRPGNAPSRPLAGQESRIVAADHLEGAEALLAKVDQGSQLPQLSDELSPTHTRSADATTQISFLPQIVAIPAFSQAVPELMTATNVPGKKFFRQRVSLALQADMHHITTPYDALLDNRGYDQIAMGYGAALAYSWENRKWGMRAQMSYRHLYYLPKPFTEIFDGDLLRGYFSESIRNIELNLISVGLHGTRTLGNLGSWHVYGLAGATCHMAVLASYDRRQQFHPGSQSPHQVQVPEPSTTSLTSQKRYPDGLLENGPFPENTYLSLDTGIGIERHFGGRLSLFLEPVFHYNPFRKSLGPNNDRINTFSTLSGVRVLL